MKHFSIKRPYVSQGLRTTYNKQVEIYEFDDETKTGIMHYQTVKLKVWKTRSAIVAPSRLRTLQDVVTGNVWGDLLTFTSYKEAYLAKFYLLDQMQKRYLQELEDLRKRMEQNCPDVAVEVAELQQQYPEYFI